MRQSQSAVIERGFELDGTHTTEPFEVAWAGEARWFIHFLTEAPSSEVEFRTQISPDGINWIDHETAPPLKTQATGLHSLPVTHFGHWLRLQSAQVTGQERPLVRVYLELKE